MERRTGPGTEGLARRQEVARGMRALRAELSRRGVHIDAVELVRESRRELEERGADRGR